MPELDWLFPRVGSEETLDSEELGSDDASFWDYDGVEGDADAAEILEGFVKSWYLLRFDSFEEAERHAGGKLVLSKFGVVKKDRTNPTTGKVTKKVRIILDCRQYQVIASTRRSHTSCPPKLAHAVRGALGMTGDPNRPAGD